MDVWRATRLFGGLSLLVLGRTSRQRKHYRVKSPIVVSPNQLSRARVSDPRGKCFLNRTSDSTTLQTVPFSWCGGSFSFIIESNQIKAFMTFQQSINLTDTPRTEYNGWSDWTTWNVLYGQGAMRDYTTQQDAVKTGSTLSQRCKSSAWIRLQMGQSGQKQTMMR